MKYVILQCSTRFGNKTALVQKESYEIGKLRDMSLSRWFNQPIDEARKVGDIEIEGDEHYLDDVYISCD
jgi:hypothetical protein